MLDRIFSGDIGATRRWSPWGLFVMALGVACVAVSGRLSGGREGRAIVLKLAGLLITAAGTLITVKLI